jgi:hypothetical protein
LYSAKAVAETSTGGSLSTEFKVDRKMLYSFVVVGGGDKLAPWAL